MWSSIIPEVERAHRLGKKKRSTKEAQGRDNQVPDSVDRDDPQSLDQVSPDLMPPATEGVHDQLTQQAAERPKPRPVIIKFLNWKDKTSVLQQVKDSKSSDIKASEDFSLMVRNIRRQLIPHMVELRRKNPKKTVALAFDKIKMGGKTFALSDFEE